MAKITLFFQTLTVYKTIFGVKIGEPNEINRSYVKEVKMNLSKTWAKKIFYMKLIGWFNPLFSYVQMIVQTFGN